MNKICLLCILFSCLLATTARAETYPEFNFNDWPTDVIEPLKKKMPELNQKQYTEEEVDSLIKKLHTEMNFDQLKVIHKNNLLYLVGTLSSKIESIRFNGLKDLDEDEAIEILSLNPQDALDENKTSLSLEKLQNYYKNMGYRKAQVTSVIVAKTSTTRDLVIQINVGHQTVISEVSIKGLPLEETKFIERDFAWNGLYKILSDTTLKNVNRSLRRSLNSLGYYLLAIPSPQIIFSADETKVRLIFSLTPVQKYKVDIKIHQNTHSPEYIESEVLNLDEYLTTDTNFGAELSEKIRLFYLSKGYAHVEIPFFERKEKDSIILTLDINEGPYVKIMKITVAGNISRPEDFYIKKLKSLASAKIQDNVMISSDIEQAAKNLIVYLQNEGFVNAKLSRIQIGTQNKKSNQALVVLQIDEGPQATIEKINITGNQFFSVEKIYEVLGLRAGQKLNLIELEKALNNLKVFYADAGFIESKILSENKNLIQYSENLTDAQIFIDLFEGPQIRVGSILIEGNNMTHGKLIQTELDFKVGDLLTPTILEESIARLQRTGHFTGIDIYTLEANTTVQERTVVVRVTERKPGIFTLGGGFTNENNLTLQGFAGLAYRNIGGWGRGASLRAEGKYNPDFIRFIESKITVGYLEPYLFDTRMRFRLNYTSSRSVTDISVRKVTLTNQTIWSLEQDFTSHLTGIYEILNVSNYVDRGIDAEAEQKFGYSREDLVISSTGPTIDIDYRDNILNPQSGNWSRFSLEYSFDSIGNHNVDDFARLTGQTTLYMLLSEEKGIVWANSYHAGYVKDVVRRGFGVPFDKKGFILGGRSTIRGFESSEFFPLTTQIGASYKLTDFSTYQLIKSELRFPLFGSHDLMGAVFYDGGEVRLDQIQFNDRYRDSMGVGLRYNTPVGPLNLEYARKLDKKSYESEGAFHLSIGVF